MARLDVYKSINDIAVLRGFPDTPHAIWLIAKGGDPDNAHQQMDVGTFIVETDGCGGVTIRERIVMICLVSGTVVPMVSDGLISGIIILVTIL